jgi:hypothetical protein
MVTKRIKILVTSRPHVRVDTYYPDVVEIPLDTNNQNDTTDYVNSSVVELEQRKLPIDLRNEIKDILIKGSNGMFLWVYLVLSELKTTTDSSPFAIRKKLNSIPKSLPDLYNRILLNIKVDDAEAAKNILRWVVWAERPLTLQELTISITIRPEHRSTSELSEMMRCDLQSDLQSILGPLINIRNGFVHLVHQSAKDYLKDMEPITSEAISARPNESNLYISISCLTYLSFDEFDRGPVVHDNCLTKNDTKEIRLHYENIPFLQYYALHCHRHVGQLDDELQATPWLQNAFLRLATSKHKMNLWFTIHPDFFYLPSGSNFWIHSVDAFSLPLIFGFNCFSQALIDHGPSGNGRVNHDKSPLLAAIEFQKETLVRFLVENGADVNAQGGFYGNPLQAAVHHGHTMIVHYLVEDGANVNAQGGYYGIPLQVAVHREHTMVVHYLVENGADVNAQGGGYGNALSAAEAKGKNSIVRFLLENGATRSSKDGG